MGSTYNLDEGADNSFSFSVGGNVYTMRYPTTEEIEAAQKLQDQPEKQLEWIYGFISPQEDGAPDIKATIGKSNIKVLKNFNTMIKTEFGV